MKQSLTAISKDNEINSTAQVSSRRFGEPVKSALPVKHSLAMDIATRINSKDIFFSLEFLPPKIPFEVRSLQKRLCSIQFGGPIFCSVTWHTGIDDPTSENETSSVSFAASMAETFSFHTMLHLAARNLTKKQVLGILQRAYSLGIRSVLALRGDPGWQCPPDGFPHAIDLVCFIRETFGDIFTVGVAGYPSGHPEAKSYECDLKSLKEKVDAGADFIISQIFFSVDTFKKFQSDCKLFGIYVPVIPGVLPILSYSSLLRILHLCHLELPLHISKLLSSLKNNDVATTNFGIHFAVNMAREILITSSVPGFHFFTLNRSLHPCDWGVTGIITIMNKNMLVPNCMQRNMEYHIGKNIGKANYRDLQTTWAMLNGSSYLYAWAENIYHQRSYKGLYN